MSRSRGYSGIGLQAKALASIGIVAIALYDLYLPSLVTFSMVPILTMFIQRYAIIIAVFIVVKSYVALQFWTGMGIGHIFEYPHLVAFILQDIVLLGIILIVSKSVMARALSRPVLNELLYGSKAIVINASICCLCLILGFVIAYQNTEQKYIFRIIHLFTSSKDEIQRELDSEDRGERIDALLVLSGLGNIEETWGQRRVLIEDFMEDTQTSQEEKVIARILLRIGPEHERRYSNNRNLVSRLFYRAGEFYILRRSFE